MSNTFINNVERINGISTPVGGVSWENKPREKDIAKKVVVHLEGCRVLYPELHRAPRYSKNGIDSILKIKDFLTNTLEEFPYNGPNRSELEKWLEEMREACNVFLTTLEEINFTQRINSVSKEVNNKAEKAYFKNLNILRITFAKITEKITKKYEIETKIPSLEILQSILAQQRY